MKKINKKHILLSCIFILIVMLFRNLNKNNFVKNQWALLNKGQKIEGYKGEKNVDINAFKAWDITLGSEEIIIAILDTGIDISLDKIKYSIFVNEKEIPDNGIDDDANGYIDDINGWNFYNEDNEVYTSYLADYHGTFITSLISSKHNNENVWGVAPNVKILPIKFMSGSSGSIDDAILGIDYAYSMGARIINCSWDTTEYNEKLYNKIKEYNDVVFVCSTGNDKLNLLENPVYPACFDLENIIAVSAINNRGEIYEFSGYNYEGLIKAPGEDVLGILPEGDYLYSDGTSFATAYVSGIIGLMKSVYNEIEPRDIIEIVQSFDGIIDTKECLEKVSKLKGD